MGVIDVLAKFFGKEGNESSKNVAKQRLRLVLLHDRVDISETLMQSLREDLIEVIGKYMEIDQSSLEVTLTREDDSVALVANIPIINVKREVS